MFSATASCGEVVLGAAGLVVKSAVENADGAGAYRPADDFARAQMLPGSRDRP